MRLKIIIVLQIRKKREMKETMNNRQIENMRRIAFLHIITLGIFCWVIADSYSVEPSSEIHLPTTVISLDGNQWLLATDPNNIGRKILAGIKDLHIPNFSKTSITRENNVSKSYIDYFMSINCQIN